MSRTRASARAAGTRFERDIADWLAAHVDDRIDRRVRTGSKDRGDIAGVRTPAGDRVVIEAKDYGGRILAAEWTTEARVEADNDDAAIAAVIAKRRGVTRPADQWVLMTLADFALLLGGDPTRSDLTAELDLGLEPAR